MKNQFTPGPWSISAPHPKGVFISAYDAGASICHFRPKVDSNAGANARLIAAAPDLLAAAKNARAHLWGRLTLEDRAVLQLIFDAIAKAEGRGDKP